MPPWLTEVLIALLAPAAALVGSYWGSRVAGRDRLRYERRVEAAETVLALLYELGSDFALWIDLRGIAGRPVDKLTEGELILGKLHRLRSYRQTRSMWLDPWVDPEVARTLDGTINRLGEWHGEFFNSMPKIPPYSEIPEGSQFEDVRASLAHWLREDWVSALRKIEHGLIGSLTSRSGRRR